MQQNVMGAKYDEANLAAAADEIQQKSQQAKLETQQKQLDINRTRLANIMSQAKVDLDGRVQGAIAEVQKDPKYQSATESEQSDMMAAAVEKAGDPMAASRIRENSALAEQRTSNAKIKASEAAHDELSRAEATIHDATPEQMKQIIASWTPEQKAVVKSQIPNYQEEDPVLLQKQLARLMQNAKGQNMAMQMAIREKMERERDETNKEIAQIRAEAQMYARMMGRDGGKEKENQERDRIRVDQKVQTEERLSKIEINKAHAATEQAATQYRASGLFGHWKDKDKSGAAWVAAKNHEDELGRDSAQSSLDQYMALDPSPFKDQMIEKYTKKLESYAAKKDLTLEDLEKEDEAKTKEGGTKPPPPAPAPKADATSNKPAPAAGGPQEGATATGPGGKKLILKGGKWVPLQ
jgi:hypothetical protein